MILTIVILSLWPFTGERKCDMLMQCFTICRLSAPAKRAKKKEQLKTEQRKKNQVHEKQRNTLNIFLLGMILLTMNKATLRLIRNETVCVCVCLCFGSVQICIVSCIVCFRTQHNETVIKIWKTIKILLSFLLSIAEWP